MDQDCHDKLLNLFLSQRNGASNYTRLNDALHDTYSESWLWSVNPGSSITIHPEPYISATRLRLGACFTCEQITHRICDKMLNINSAQALCCVPGEGTTGHNEIRDAIFDITI